MPTSHIPRRVSQRRVAASPAAVDRAFRPARGVDVAPAGESGLVLRTAHDRCAFLRGMGERVWALLDRGASLRTIRGLLRREYGMPHALAETELPELLGRLERGGFIERTP